MTDDEKFTFIGTTCLAGRCLGIYGRFEGNAFRWFDPMANRFQWTTPEGTDKKDILFKACESLTAYLCPTAPQK